jgi:hypothetical protein
MSRHCRTSPSLRQALPVLGTLLLGAATLAAFGCAGAFHGATTGAYFAAGGYSDNAGSYCASAYDGRGGSDADVFLLGAIVVGATIGAIIEIFKWAADGCSNW